MHRRGKVNASTFLLFPMVTDSASAHQTILQKEICELRPNRLGESQFHGEDKRRPGLLSPQVWTACEFSA
jgi:hypothetical protein